MESTPTAGVWAASLGDVFFQVARHRGTRHMQSRDLCRLHCSPSPVSTTVTHAVCRRREVGVARGLHNFWEQLGADHEALSNRLMSAGTSLGFLREASARPSTTV
jgi:hypothetical protein